MIRLAIDRFEDGLAVCETEDGQSMTFPCDLLPPDSREGDWLLLREDGVLLADPEETERRRAQILALQRKLFGRKSRES